MLRTGNLIKAYYFSGGVGLLCCFQMHHLGTGDARTPITIEYSLGNPLAIAFFMLAFVSAAVSAWLFHRGNARAESVLSGAVTACIGVLMVTSSDSAAHSIALFTAVFLAAFVPAIYVLKSEFSWVSIILLSAPLSLTFVVAIASLSPSSPLGLGIAERLWYATSFLVNAKLTNMLYDEGRLSASARSI